MQLLKGFCDGDYICLQCFTRLQMSKCHLYDD